MKLLYNHCRLLFFINKELETKTRWRGVGIKCSSEIWHSVTVSLSSTITKESTHLKIKKFEFCLLWHQLARLPASNMFSWVFEMVPCGPGSLLTYCVAEDDHDLLVLLPQSSAGMTWPRILSQRRRVGKDKKRWFCCPLHTLNFGLCFLDALLELGFDKVKTQKSTLYP